MFAKGNATSLIHLLQSTAECILKGWITRIIWKIPILLCSLRRRQDFQLKWELLETASQRMFWVVVAFRQKKKKKKNCQKRQGPFATSRGNLYPFVACVWSPGCQGHSLDVIERILPWFSLQLVSPQIQSLTFPRCLFLTCWHFEWLCSPFHQPLTPGAPFPFSCPGSEVQNLCSPLSTGVWSWRVLKYLRFVATTIKGRYCLATSALPVYFRWTESLRVHCQLNRTASTI